MTRDEVIAELTARAPSFAAGEVAYLDRRGDDYRWRPADGDLGPIDADLPDAWLFHSGPWPTADRAAAFVEDLLAELDAMLGGDRCRWPLDQPWPHGH